MKAAYRDIVQFDIASLFTVSLVYTEWTKITGARKSISIRSILHALIRRC